MKIFVGNALHEWYKLIHIMYLYVTLRIDTKVLDDLPFMLTIISHESAGRTWLLLAGKGGQ